MLTAPDTVVAAVEDPVIDLLKQLLPVDSPVGSVLERFRQALTTSMTEQSTDDAIGKILVLLKSLPVDLKTVTGEGLRSAIDRLGLRYEPMLQAAFAQHVRLSPPLLTAQNLKAALLTLLEAPLPEVSVNGPSTPTLPGSAETEPLSPSPSVPRPVSPAPIQQTQLPHAQSPVNVTAPPQLAAAFTQLVRENLETILLQQLQAQSKAVLIHQPETILPEEKAVPPAPTPQQSGKPLQQDGNPPQGERLLPVDALEHVLQSLNPGGDHDIELGLRKLLQATLASENGKEISDPTSKRPTAFSGDDLQPVKNSSLVEQIRQVAGTKVAAAVPQESAQTEAPPAGLPAPITGKQGTDVRQQAHELLTAIERTQVLNSVNNERGEPLTFQIPFLLDGRASTAEFYVERRFEDGRKTDPEERHYSVIALLDLSELGALRVDLAMHKKQLSVKVTVEREETELLAVRRLSVLRQTLGEQGFAVEFLKCERKNDGSAKGADLRDRTLPGNSLINLRV
ncbi:MAG: flagellar hook-length control protein FliK [Nitrospirota bacterium]